MRPLLPCLLLSLSLLPAAARAEDRTEAIRFTFLNAAAAEETLLATALVSPDRFVLPKGIKAWAVDARENALVVTGEPQAIEQVKQLARLLDVPATRVRLSVRSVKLDPATLAELKKAGAVQLEGVTVAPLFDEEPRKRVEAAPASFSTTLTVSNNHPLRLRLPRGERAPLALSIVPRVNADRSVTLTIPNWGQVNGNRDAPPSLFTLRRVASGDSIVVSGGPFHEPLVIRVETLP